MHTAAQSQPRLAHVDALRGFALCGILVVNSQMIASPYHAHGLADPAFSGALDLAARWAVAFVFEAKFYLLFSFLFGYSFTLQMAAAERSPAAFAPRMRRRLAGLAVLGLAHAVLFYPGDILLAYALLGLLLLAWRRLDPTKALRRALWIGTVAATLWLLLGLLSLWMPWNAADDAPYVADAQAAIAAHRGSLGSTLAQNLREWAGTVWWQLMLVQGPFVVAMFLAGYALGRREALADPWRVPASLWKLLGLGLLPGLAGAALYAGSGQPASDPAWKVLGFAAGLLTAPLLSLAYACAFLLAWRAPWGQRVGAWLVPAGRMALSNYLLQSALCALVFTGWGLRLVGAVSPLAVLGLAVAIFALQLPLSAWWLRGHVHGPVEWLLRALTLAALPPWRRQGAAG